MRIRAEDENGDYQFGYGANDFFVNSPQAVAQLVENRLELNRGEWFLDQSQGLPWTAEFLAAAPTRRVDLEVQDLVLSTPGVLEITEYASFFDRASRELSIALMVSTIYGPAQISTTL